MRAASRARAAVRHFSMMRSAVGRILVQILAEPSATAVWTAPLTSALPSLALVWPSNCGSVQLDADDRRQALADVVAGQVRVGVLEHARSCRAQSLRVRVKAARKPVTCVPPSTVLMLLAKE